MTPGQRQKVNTNTLIISIFILIDLPKLKAMMTDGKPDSIHGALIEAKIAASDDGISISLVDA